MRYFLLDFYVLVTALDGVVVLSLNLKDYCSIIYTNSETNVLEMSTSGVCVCVSSQSTVYPFLLFPEIFVYH